ncbi:MAG: hypothetical protein ACKO0Z_02270 [Betaproteobacteria bacterium]
MAETPETRAKGILKSLVSRLARHHNVHVDWETAPTSAYGATTGQSDITLTLRDKLTMRNCVWYIEVKAKSNTASAKQVQYLQRKFRMGCEAWVLWADDTQDLLAFAERFVCVARALALDLPSVGYIRLKKYGEASPSCDGVTLFCEPKTLQVAREFNKELLPLTPYAPPVKGE